MQGREIIFVVHARRAALLLLLPALLARGEGRQLAPAMGADEPAESAADPNPEWNLCRVQASLLATAPARSLVTPRVEQFVTLGESLEVEEDLVLPTKGGQALVHVRARLRAAAARAGGVSYLVHGDGVLKSTIGFQAQEIGDSQYRSEVLDINDELSHLVEVFARPDLGLRVMLAVRAVPAMAADAITGVDALRPPEGDPRELLVEMYLKEGTKLTLLDNAHLAAYDGRTANYSLARFSARGPGRTSLGLAPSSVVTPIAVKGVPMETRPAVPTVTPDDTFQRRIEAVQNVLHLTTDLGAAPRPGQFTTSTPRKISERRRKRILEEQQERDLREMAIEQSKTLPADTEVPDAFQREALSLVITPLRASQEALQVHLALEGHVKLPGDEALSPLDLKTVEAVPFDEPFEIALAQLVRGGEPEYDYLLRITPVR